MILSQREVRSARGAIAPIKPVRPIPQLNAERFSLRTSTGGPFREVSRAELEALLDARQIRVVVRGKGIRRIYLTVPPDVAGKTLGENSNYRGVDSIAHFARSTAKADRIDREQSAPGSHTELEWLQLLEECGHRCARCQCHVKEVGYLTKDHIEPLVNGGSNFISNIQPLCQRCNSWKGKRTIDFRHSAVVSERQ